MNALLPPLDALDAFKQTRDALSARHTPVLATGVVDSQKWHLLAGLLSGKESTVLIVTASELKAKEIYEDIYYYFRETAYLYPSRDVIFYAADVKSADIARQRFKVIDAMLGAGARAVVLSAEALLDRLTPPEILRKHILRLKPGDVIAPEELARKLVFMGYERQSLVEGPGQFALRGGIMDIYAIALQSDADTENQAIRLEFFGDEIDSLRLLDTYSQRSLEKCGHALLYPIKELVYDDATLLTAVEKIRREYEQTKTGLRRKNMRAEAQALTDMSEETLTRLSEEMNMPNIESFFPFFYGTEINLLDYLPHDTIICFDEPNRVNAHMEIVTAEFEDSINHRLLAGRLLPSQAGMILPYAAALHKANAFPILLFTSMTQKMKDFTPRALVSFTVKSCVPLRRRPSDLREDLSHWLTQGYRIAVLAGPRRHGQTLAEEIAGLNIPVRYADTLDSTELPPGMVTVTRGSMMAGFEYPGCKLAVITDKELFTADKKKRRKAKRGGKNAAAVEHFTDLRPGDYIVHDNHGIGVFKGIEQIVTDGLSRDYLKLEYADGGHLYVQTAQMDLIQKYIGGAETAKLSKLGGADWAKAKSRARRAVKELAEDLVALYAKRQASEGFTYTQDSVWQSEFEALFPYEETDDQTAAIADVKQDMESGKVMDRLICGDVGYGKTEIAIRAAFKAVQDNKQVAYLVPTTILAQQHYNTFRTRMKDYPVLVERLSRFQTRKEQQESVRKLLSGEVDIVIGTHRLLSKDVRFKDLGLIIVDEEQRFGVGHKEKLKALRASVDVLTLTATPIPRTLHLSLTGIRDMSLLDEPPEERLPVQTYVMEYNAEFVRDAINRELARGGQVYYLHNRVRNIVEEAARVRALVPQARVAFAHGQMSEHELENIMMEFVDGYVQVLVCTTIVETGLDIPNVNTIIIQDADFMGLSQLYQLRGRVGRSNRLAYAYLMYRRDKVLPENAEKRLQTIREFTEFGSGFKIAMRDLEIRGAGNLLGAEQHGHMDLVGYDMYCKLLAEAVSELRGLPVEEVFETSIDITVDAYIPLEYIQDEQQKLEMYKKMSLIVSQRDYADMQEEMEDRFGDPPRPVLNLLDVALLKAEAHSLGAVSIAQRQRNVVVTFKPDANVDLDKLTQLVTNERARVMFTMAPNPYLTIRFGEKVSDGAEAVRVTRELLTGLA
jgi:transcription-repair coupling factor (superfamily II helicase)